MSAKSDHPGGRGDSQEGSRQGDANANASANASPGEPASDGDRLNPHEQDQQIRELRQAADRLIANSKSLIEEARRLRREAQKLKSKSQSKRPRRDST